MLYDYQEEARNDQSSLQMLVVETGAIFAECATLFGRTKEKSRASSSNAIQLVFVLLLSWEPRSSSTLLVA
jgi:hypothetical protein